MARKALRKVKPPPDLAYLLGWYNDIRAGQSSGMSHNPLSHTEILAYRDLFDMDMDAFDVDTLRRLDALWLKSVQTDDGETLNG